MLASAREAIPWSRTGTRRAVLAHLAGPPEVRRFLDRPGCRWNKGVESHRDGEGPRSRRVRAESRGRQKMRCFTRCRRHETLCQLASDSNDMSLGHRTRPSQRRTKLGSSGARENQPWPSRGNTSPQIVQIVQKHRTLRLRSRERISEAQGLRVHCFCRSPGLRDDRCPSGGAEWVGWAWEAQQDGEEQAPEEECQAAPAGAEVGARAPSLPCKPLLRHPRMLCHAAVEVVAARLLLGLLRGPGRPAHGTAPPWSPAAAVDVFWLRWNDPGFLVC